MESQEKVADASEQPFVHTPGPWELGDENNQCCEVVLGTSHNLTASLDRRDRNTGEVVITRDEMLANARLIAASPDLLEALEQCLRYIESDEYTHGRNFASGNVARDAIEKATGTRPAEVV